MPHALRVLGRACWRELGGRRKEGESRRAESRPTVGIGPARDVRGLQASHVCCLLPGRREGLSCPSINAACLEAGLLSSSPALTLT